MWKGETFHLGEILHALSCASVSELLLAVGVGFCYCPIFTNNCVSPAKAGLAGENKAHQVHREL